MLVEDIMIKSPITISKHHTIKEAMELLHENKIRHIPVIDDNNTLIGIVSDRDIRDASPSIFHLNDNQESLLHSVEKIMKYPVITVHPLDFIEEAAVSYYENNISALPVVTEDDQLKGLLTETDVLHVLVQLTGAHEPSSRIEVKVPNVSGQLANIATIFKEENVNVTSLLVYPGAEPEWNNLTFRVQTMDPRDIIKHIQANGYEVQGPRLPGMDI
ncbi:acetoin utilization AcuB family protein [Alteribacillus iranensis]|uniref:Acetoin utilization protein AcuB n=1 Tax=Alteribacillus iranensis TaxID=930128 RepID=A0A1I2FK41_9BACI|nr:acetoin utilization AcuB family protein [Alteribacillus iranensis]SFF05128.1 acetoin utilization protein AcuB [Alteribacillus iranensis]